MKIIKEKLQKHQAENLEKENKSRKEFNYKISKRVY